MKLTRNKKVFLPVLIIVTLICSSLFASAASTKKMLEAYYGVKIQYNGNILTSSTQPFIVNGTTYVPLRMIMDNFGDKSVQWNGESQTVIITSSVSNMEAVYMQQVVSRNKQIDELKAQVAKLQDDNAYLRDQINNPDVDLDDLEDDINDDYEDYEDKDFNFYLDGDNDKIELTVKVDQDDWSDLSQSKKEDLLDDICDDIWDEAEDADIEGEVKDGSKVLDEFSVDPDDNVELKDIDDKLDDLAEDIEDDRKDDWDDEDFDLDLSISGDEDDIEYKVTIDLDDDQDEWDSLSNTELKGLMDDIYDDIDDEYGDADITGVVYDKDSRDNAATYDGSDLDRLID